MPSSPAFSAFRLEPIELSDLANLKSKRADPWWAQLFIQPCAQLALLPR
jgi:hypothetical protein